MQTLDRPTSTAGNPYAWPERPLVAPFHTFPPVARPSLPPSRGQYAGFGGNVRHAVQVCRTSKGNTFSSEPRTVVCCAMCVAYGSVSFACVYKGRALAFYASPPHVRTYSIAVVFNFFLLDTANTKKGKCLIFLCQQRWDKTCNFLFMFFFWEKGISGYYTQYTPCIWGQLLRTL